MVHTAIKIQLVHMQLCGYFLHLGIKIRNALRILRRRIPAYNMIVLWGIGKMEKSILSMKSRNYLLLQKGNNVVGLKRLTGCDMPERDKQKSGIRRNPELIHFSGV